MKCFLVKQKFTKFAFSIQKPERFDTKELISAILRTRFIWKNIVTPHEIVDINLLSIELPSARQLRLHYYPLHPLTPYTLYHIISFSLGTVQSAVGCLLT